jgi:hypothetical protein
MASASKTVNRGKYGAASFPYQKTEDWFRFVCENRRIIENPRASASKNVNRGKNGAVSCPH